MTIHARTILLFNALTILSMLVHAFYIYACSNNFILQLQILWWRRLHPGQPQISFRLLSRQHIAYMHRLLHHLLVQKSLFFSLLLCVYDVDCNDPPLVVTQRLNFFTIFLQLFIWYTFGFYNSREWLTRLTCLLSLNSNITFSCIFHIFLHESSPSFDYYNCRLLFSCYFNEYTKPAQIILVHYNLNRFTLTTKPTQIIHQKRMNAHHKIYTSLNTFMRQNLWPPW